MEFELKPLVAERGLIKAALTRLKRYYKESASTASQGSLQKRLESGNELIKEFNAVQRKIELIVANTELELVHESERELFENTYFDVIGELEDYVKEKQDSRESSRLSSASPASTSVPATARGIINLPTIKLPDFEGNLNEWLGFRDTFNSLVHRNESLSDVQKYHYLISALKGSAARAIRALHLSEDHYSQAWETLKNRYEDPVALREHHMDAFLNLSPIQRRSKVVLQEFIDDATNHLSALKTLGEPVESWDFIVVTLLSRKLDGVTRKEWNDRVSGCVERASYKQFSEFIEKKSKSLETNERYTQNFAQNNDRQPKASGSRVVGRPTAHVVSNPVQCPVCYDDHALYNCKTFKDSDLQTKRNIVQKTNRCFNCLATGHRVQKCSRRRCSACNKLHHTLLHSDGPPLQSPTNPKVQDASRSMSIVEGRTSPTYATNVASGSGQYTVLSTAIVYVEDSTGKRRDCRVLLDSGSQVHLITRDFCEDLGLVETPIEANVSGLGRAVNAIKGSVDLKIFSRCNGFHANIDCLAIDNITTDMPNIPLNRIKILTPHNIILADPRFNECRRVDLLIGAGLFWKLLCIGQHKSGSDLLWQKTQLGWVLGGKMTWPQDHKPKPNRCHVVTNAKLHEQIEQFWRLEELPNTNATMTNECETYFQTTTKRDVDGRYIVRIPFREPVEALGSSRNQAERRLRSLEKRLDRQPDLRKQYVEFMNEYESLGHMSEVPECLGERESGFYLPHHAVSKETSTTTKVRVVFDGSAKSSSGISLNDTQVVGPTVQNDLFSILIRFRKHRYVLSADVTKMYRQILIHPADRKFQRILWRSDSNSQIKTFELKTVTYGTASAPFLATRVLKQIGLECAETLPDTSQSILNDFYVDDLLTGAPTISAARKRKQELSDMLAQAGFPLRKWASNCVSVLSEADGKNHHKQISSDKDPKTLGLLWASEEDILHFSATLTTHPRVTKRAILSEIAQIFDPLGLIGPIITKAKIIMQQLWHLGLGWDESISQDLHGQWIQFRNEMQELTHVKIPRRVLVDQPTGLEIHGFSDSSERAYGACIYLRSLVTPGTWKLRLLCSKSRVAPLKVVSLPRLELCGALLLAQLTEKVKTAMNLSYDKEWYWSDSTITLAWIEGSSTRWKTFVANRVAEIQRLTNKNQWRHVRSEDNPADLISRGTTPSDLAGNDLWWSGPEWLCRDHTSWPSNVMKLETVPEERQTKTVMTLITANNDFNLFGRFSSYTRLVRVTAYCKRFIDKARKIGSNNEQPVLPNIGNNLTVVEIRQAEKLLVHLAQKEMFSAVITALENKGPMVKVSSLNSLHPFLDGEGLIRVGGRLAKASIPYETKHPLIIPGKHALTDLIINHEHIRLLHAGAQLVLGSLRERFWPISGMRNVRRVLHKCVKCFRSHPRNAEYLMGQLPASRITPARPFYTCGIDYAGPFLTKEGVRSKVTKKAYLCVFVCFVTKAVHLELATDLSTEAFLNCLRRFIARRGRCRCIVTDNGTNFIGARNALGDLGILLRDKGHNSVISDFLSKENIEWRLNPPQTPHFGGLWEGAVKATKRHLTRVIGEQRLTFEELYTLLTQVESCLNSRPLTPISTDPNDFTPLTPGHFLIGDALNALPEHDLREVNTNRLNRYQLIQQMFQHFWQRWRKEYLHQLQQRVKWRTSAPFSWTIGMMVIVKEDNLPPLRWKLGRVMELHEGTDGVIRVVSIKTSDGIYKRPVVKLCLLPIEDAEDEHR